MLLPCRVVHWLFQCPVDGVLQRKPDVLQRKPEVHRRMPDGLQHMPDDAESGEHHGAAQGKSCPHICGSLIMRATMTICQSVTRLACLLCTCIVCGSQLLCCFLKFAKCCILCACCVLWAAVRMRQLNICRRLAIAHAVTHLPNYGRPRKLLFMIICGRLIEKKNVARYCREETVDRGYELCSKRRPAWYIECELLLILNAKR